MTVRGADAELRIDAAIGQVVRLAHLPGDRRALADLVALGPPALRRAVEIWYHVPRGDQTEALTDAQASRHPREIIDAWARLFAELARAYPDAYVHEIAAGRLTIPRDHATMEMAVLGLLENAGAAAVLRTHAGHPNWLVRLQVVRGLARRTDPDSRRTLATFLEDEQQMVRSEAATALAG